MPRSAQLALVESPYSVTSDNAGDYGRARANPSRQQPRYQRAAVAPRPKVAVIFRSSLAS